MLKEVKNVRYKAIKTKLYLKKGEQRFLQILMRASKSLYNEALYNVRQYFFETGKFLTYEENDKRLSKESEHYRILSTSQGQSVIRKVDEAMKAFFGSLKSNVKQKVKCPRYLDKLGYYPLVDRMVYKPKSEYYVMPRGNFIKKVSKYIIEATQKISRLASVRPNQKVLTKRMIRLIEKRNNQMIYGINKAAKVILNHALENHVGEIIIGYNDSFKDSKISKQMNQWFRSIPIARLRDRILYLAKQYDIKTSIVNESYTSISSYIDQDELKKSNFSGKRIKRGLYRSKDGISINADLNAALNILKKSKPDAKRIGSKGWNTPKRTFIFS